MGTVRRVRELLILVGQHGRWRRVPPRLVPGRPSPAAPGPRARAPPMRFHSVSSEPVVAGEVVVRREDRDGGRVNAGHERPAREEPGPRGDWARRVGPCCWCGVSVPRRLRRHDGAAATAATPSRRLRSSYSNRDISAVSKPSIENAQFCSFCSRAASRPRRNGLADTPSITAARCRAPGILASRHGLPGTTVTPAAGKPSTMALPSHHQGEGPEHLVDLATTPRRRRWCR